MFICDRRAFVYLFPPMCALGALGFVSFSSLYVRLEPFGYLLPLPHFASFAYY